MALTTAAPAAAVSPRCPPDPGTPGVTAAGCDWNVSMLTSDQTDKTMPYCISDAQMDSSTGTYAWNYRIAWNGNPSVTYPAGYQVKYDFTLVYPETLSFNGDPDFGAGDWAYFDLDANASGSGAGDPAYWSAETTAPAPAGYDTSVNYKQRSYSLTFTAKGGQSQTDELTICSQVSFYFTGAPSDLTAAEVQGSVALTQVLPTTPPSTVSCPPTGLPSNAADGVFKFKFDETSVTSYPYNANYDSYNNDGTKVIGALWGIGGLV